MNSYPRWRLFYLHLFAVGMLAAPAQAWDWQPQPSKADLLVIGAHPDDEGIFFGGVLPYYTQVQHRHTVLVDMVSASVGSDPTIREDELRNASWVYGLRNEPIFARFSAHGPTSGDQLAAAWDAWDGTLDGVVADDNQNGVPDGREFGALYMAEQIRRYKPAVIATHDFDGEYGHGAHQATAWCATDAFSLAADASVNIADLPAWQADKLYIHQSQANGLGTNGEVFQSWLFHDFWEDVSIDTDGDGTPDGTPRQVANVGLKCHVSQGLKYVSTVYLTGENYNGHHSEWWGLYASTVGTDTADDPFTIMGYNYNGWARGDFFEHVVSVPEPGTLVLLIAGSLSALAVRTTRKGKARKRKLL